MELGSTPPLLQGWEGQGALLLCSPRCPPHLENSSLCGAPAVTRRSDVQTDLWSQQMCLCAHVVQWKGHAVRVRVQLCDVCILWPRAGPSHRMAVTTLGERPASRCAAVSAGGLSWVYRAQKRETWVLALPAPTPTPGCVENCIGPTLS